MTARDLDSAADQLRPASYVRWVTDDMRADAAAYITRRGCDDLLEMLGLADPADAVLWQDGRRHCAVCHRAIRADRAVCRRTPTCTGRPA